MKLDIDDVALAGLVELVAQMRLENASNKEIAVKVSMGAIWCQERGLAELVDLSASPGTVAPSPTEGATP